MKINIGANMTEDKKYGVGGFVGPLRYKDIKERALNTFYGHSFQKTYMFLTLVMEIL